MLKRSEENEPAYCPYETKNEFLIDLINNNFYILNKITGNRYIPTGIMSYGIETIVDGSPIIYNWGALFENFIWDNGSPCGIKK